MKEEYILSDEQKKEIARLNHMIFDLKMKIASIYMMAKVRYITETEEECENVRKYFCISDKPPLSQGVVNIKFGNEEQKE